MNLLTRFYLLCKAKDGAALVELALVIPMLLAFVFGAIDLGRAYFVGLEVTNAAHAAAEYASQNFANLKAATVTATDIKAAATQSAPELKTLNLVVTPTWGCECSDNSSTTSANSYSASCTPPPTTCGSNIVYTAQVQASAVYTPLMPWAALGLPSSFTLTRTATMRGDYTPTP